MLKKWVTRNLHGRCCVLGYIDKEVKAPLFLRRSIDNKENPKRIWKKIPYKGSNVQQYHGVKAGNGTVETDS